MGSAVYASGLGILGGGIYLFNRIELNRVMIRETSATARIFAYLLQEGDPQAAIRASTFTMDRFQELPFRPTHLWLFSNTGELVLETARTGASAVAVPEDLVPGRVARMGDHAAFVSLPYDVGAGQPRLLVTRFELDRVSDAESLALWLLAGLAALAFFTGGWLFARVAARQLDVFRGMLSAVRDACGLPPDSRLDSPEVLIVELARLANQARCGQAVAMASSRRIRAILSATPYPMFEFDADSNLLAVLAGPAEVIQRFETRGCIGAPVEKSVPADVAMTIRQAIDRASREFETQRIDYSYVARGRRFSFEAWIAPMEADTQADFRAIMLAVDRTELLDAREKLAMPRN